MKANAAAIREIRRIRNLTQYEIAHKSGVTEAFISLVERGLRGATPPTLRRLAAALDVDLAAITLPTEGTHEPPQAPPAA